MFTAEPTLGTPQTHRIRYAGTLAAAVTLIAIVAVLFLPGSSAKTGTSDARPTAIGPAANVPLIQYRGTGEPPAAPASHRTQGALATVGLLRAEHSYGEVP